MILMAKFTHHLGKKYLLEGENCSSVESFIMMKIRG
jgi:hypothetical protein